MTIWSLLGYFLPVVTAYMYMYDWQRIFFPDIHVLPSLICNYLCCLALFINNTECRHVVFDSILLPGFHVVWILYLSNLSLDLCLDRFNWENLSHSNLQYNLLSPGRDLQSRWYKDLKRCLLSLFFLHSCILLYLLCSIFFSFHCLECFWVLGIKIIVKSKCINRSFGTKAHFPY